MTSLKTAAKETINNQGHPLIGSNFLLYWKRAGMSWFCPKIIEAKNKSLLDIIKLSDWTKSIMTNQRRASIEQFFFLPAWGL